MRQMIIVAFGGAAGALARYKLGGLVFHHSSDWKFPLSTFVINVSGCFAAGVLAGLAEKRDLLGADTRLFLFTGLLGGYTTFSAFGVETVYLIQRSEYLYAILNAASSVAAGVSALWLGIKLIPLS